MATRWRWPPLNSCGYLPKARPSSPTFSAARARAARARPVSAPMPWMAIGSTSVWPMVKRGFRLAYGFWKTIWMRRRISWRSRSLARSRFWPSKMTSPPVGSCRRSSVRPIVVLPEPDSPTTPSVWPRRSVKLTSCTALNSRLPNTPCAARSSWPASAPPAPPARRVLGLRAGAAAACPAMWSSITISRAGLPSRLGRQASSALV
jgi:hypothetical protein